MRQHPTFKIFQEVMSNKKQMTMEEANKILISNEELRKHSTADNAWVSYKGYVYDVTKYLKYHPGGVGCFSTYFGYDVTKITGGVHGFVNIFSFICKCLVGKLDGEPVNPVPTALKTERGQL